VKVSFASIFIPILKRNKKLSNKKIQKLHFSAVLNLKKKRCEKYRRLYFGQWEFLRGILACKNVNCPFLNFAENLKTNVQFRLN